MSHLCLVDKRGRERNRKNGRGITEHSWFGKGQRVCVAVVQRVKMGVAEGQIVKSLCLVILINKSCRQRGNTRGH